MGSLGDLHNRNILVGGDGVRLIDFGTSAFQRPRHKSRQRESQLLVRLARQLIHDEDPATIWAESFKKMPPQLCLAALNAWVELVYLTSVPRPDLFHDYMEVRNLAFRLSLVVEKHPYFRVPVLLEWLATKDLPRMDGPLLQYLQAGLTASLAGRSEFEIPKLGGEPVDHVAGIEDLRQRLAALYVRGERKPSSFLATWHSL